MSGTTPSADNLSIVFQESPRMDTAGDGAAFADYDSWKGWRARVCRYSRHQIGVPLSVFGGFERGN